MKSQPVQTILAGCFTLGTFLALVSKFLNSVTGHAAVLIFTFTCFLVYLVIVISVTKNKAHNRIQKILISAFAAATAGNLILLIVFFRNGEYCNYGMVGIYYAVMIITVPYLICGAIISLQFGRE